MDTVIREGLEVDPSEINIRSGRIVRLGPLNVPAELKYVLEEMAEEEVRSISGMVRVLIEDGMKYRELMKSEAR